MNSYIMSVDCGTTSERCIIFDKECNIVSSSQKEFRQIYPFPGWVEQDPEDIWQTALYVCRDALDKAGISSEQISAIGITNQRETTIMWDKSTGRPVYNAIVWQCRRTSDIVDKLKADGCSEMISGKTGLLPDAYFSATKLKWIFDNILGVRESAEKGEILFGTVETWIIWKLTNGSVHATDYTNASRTMLYNIYEKKWDEELLSLFGIPSSVLPSVLPSSGLYGYTDKSIFGTSLPIMGAAGDQQSALFGQCCFRPGMTKSTYGTGGFLLMNTGDKPVKSAGGLLTTISCGSGPVPGYAAEGSVFVAGACVQWLRDEMKLIGDSRETEEIANSVPDTLGCYMVPAFTGLGAPYWDQNARGIICGITRGVRREHIIRAALEAIAYEINDVIGIMKSDSLLSDITLKIDGGAAQNNFIAQFQADISNVTVVRPCCIETTALGAAFLAGLACGYWSSLDDITRYNKAERIFEPTMPESKRKSLIDGWNDAVSKARA